MSLSSYSKRYQCKEAMTREWAALEQCKGRHIQRALSVDEEALSICFEFDQKAKALTEFADSDLPLFIALYPNIVRAIAHCHNQGWVHGDIKPSNILYLGKEQNIRLIDFGASYPIGTCRATLSTWQLTPTFASVNQRAGVGLVEAADDWFALQKIIEQISGLSIRIL